MEDLRRLLQHAGGGNQGKVLRALMIRPGNQADLAKRSGVVAATVGNILGSLERHVQRDRDGREVKVSLKPLRGIAVGVELGYHRSVVVARRIDASDEVTLECDRGAKDGADRWAPEVLAKLGGVLESLGEPFEDIATAGLGVPGVVDPRHGTMVPPRLPLWRGDENPANVLQAALRERAPTGSLQADVRVKLDNDATLGALAESVYKHSDAEILLFVKSSTGVGAGIVVGGQVLRGAVGGAGELGHMVIDPQGAFCVCGGRGCLQTVVGASAMLRNARAALTDVSTDRPPNNLAELVSKAQAGNQICRRVLHEAALALGATLGNVCNVLNPNVIVLGGTLGTAEELVLDGCRSALRQTAMTATAGVRVVSTTLQNPSARGALVLGIQGSDSPDPDPAED